MPVGKTKLGFITKSHYVPPMTGSVKTNHSFHKTHAELFHASGAVAPGEDNRVARAQRHVGNYHKGRAREIETGHIKKHVKGAKAYHTAITGSPAIRSGKQKAYVTYKQKKKKRGGK